MLTDYEIAAWHPSMKPEIIELTKQLWSADAARNAAYFEWKHERNPYTPEPLIHVALHHGRVIGMRTMFGMEWEVGPSALRFPLLYADDLVVAQEHRNRGLVNAILKEAMRDASRRGYSHLINLSASPITRASSLAAGWKSAGSMNKRTRRPAPAGRTRRLRRLLRKNRLVRWIAGRVGWRPGSTGSHRLSDLPPQSDRQLLVERDARPHEMAKLVARLGHDGRIRHVRDATYLSWRYLNPLHRYLFLYWTDPDLSGYLVLQERVDGWSPTSAVNIVDWEAASPSIAASLLLKAVELCGASSLTIWSATLPESSKRLLDEQAFKAAPFEGVTNLDDWLLLQSLDDSHPESTWTLDGFPLLDLTSWDLRMIYSMHG